MSSTNTSDSATVHQPLPGTEAAIKSDSNADAHCPGKNFVVLECTAQQVDAFTCDKSTKPLKNVPVVSAATARTDQETNITHALVINEGSRCGDKPDHSLFNPNQLQSCGIPAWDNPFDCEWGLPVSPLEHDVTIPLKTKGTKVFFDARAPTPEESHACVHVNLTSENDWNPMKFS